MYKNVTDLKLVLFVLTIKATYHCTYVSKHGIWDNLSESHKYVNCTLEFKITHVSPASQTRCVPYFSISLLKTNPM